MFPGSLASCGDSGIINSIAQQGIAPALRQMLQADGTVSNVRVSQCTPVSIAVAGGLLPSTVWIDESPTKMQGPSEGVRQGVRRCALRCINTCAAASPQLAAALQQAGVGGALQVHTSRVLALSPLPPLAVVLVAVLVALTLLALGRWLHIQNYLAADDQRSNLLAGTLSRRAIQVRGGAAAGTGCSAAIGRRRQHRGDAAFMMYACRDRDDMHHAVQTAVNRVIFKASA